MEYTEVELNIDPLDPWRQITLAELGELRYDAFEDTQRGLNAYVLNERFDAPALKGLLVLHDPHVNATYHVRRIEARNWNAEWESSFKPVEVGKEVRIRAEFHPSVPGFTHELIITPRMAFGTGHHATTRMMVQAMLGLELDGQEVCDLGCGTGVLAFLAERMGAAHVLAIDIDAGAVENAIQNAELNGCKRTTVEKGDVSGLKGRRVGTILANIERNTLMRDMEAMCAALSPGGALLLSGFVIGDRHMLVQCAVQAGLTVVERLQEGEWALIGCRKYE